MHTIDMHCDTLMSGYFYSFSNIAAADIYTMPDSVDLKRLHEAGAMAQFFAIFLPSSDTFEWFKVPQITDKEYIAGCAQVFHQSIAAHSDIVSKATNAAEIKANFAAGKVSAVLTMEDGRAVNGKLENIKRFYDMGVRALSLTWNEPNCFGFPNAKDPNVMSRGLTDFGKDAVIYMQELGMLVDVSHLSDGGFYDVAKICKKPFVATHSNCRSLSPHQRNLTDDMLRVLGDAGGVTGINFGPEFLNADVACTDSTAALMASHARHMANYGGIGCVALGTDFDGIDGNLQISDPTKMELLADALKAAGFTSGEIDQIAWGNAMRVLEEAVK